MPSLDEVNGLLNTNNIDVLCISETWLSADVDDRYLVFPGYCVIRRDRKARGGGVCVIYRASLDPVVLDVPTAGSSLETLWLGDLNWDVLQPSKPGVRQYLDLLQDLSLSQLVMTPTRSAPNSPPSLLDHLITSHPGLCYSTRVVMCDISDHALIVTRVTGTRARRALREITIRSTKRLDKDHLCLTS